MEFMPYSGQTKPLTPALLLLMSVSCGLAIANLYYNQPLLADMGRTFGVDDQHSGIISMLTQIGFAVGMFLFIPLGDIYEKRKLITVLLLAVGLALIFLATAQTLMWLYAASLAVGITTVTPQIMVPLAAEIAAPNERGKAIGSVMSGLLTGILLARTVAGFIGELFGWRVMFGFAAAMMFGMAFILFRQLPASQSRAKLTYNELIRSIGQLISKERTLRESALIGAFMFGAFSAFWTTLTFFLEGPSYQYGSTLIGLFGLIGVVGAATASIIGRLADHVSPKRMIGWMSVVVLLSYLSFGLLGTWLWGLILGVVLLDLGYQGVHVSNQARIYSLLPDAGSRLNTVYMVSSFLGGSIGSACGAAAWSHWGWFGACAVGGGMAAMAFLVWLAHRLSKRE
ncbi:MFS transporter [Paenibacillus sp. 1P07SE]|uniref:MFS transporter n=1 Tax=Paenibacillus sp. 1P07SE TaxID=3132209 RepID=UPI0039A5ACE6